MNAKKQALTDVQLILKFQKGDRDALEVLINRHKDKMYSSILFLVKDQYLAEDIFQDTFVRIINKLCSGTHYTEEGKFYQWAMRIAHNLTIDYFRKVNRSPKIVTSDNRDIFEVLNFNTYESGEQKLMKRDSYHRLHTMIAELPYDQREVIILRHFADLSFKEISDMTGCSINTALGRMRYGLLNLRKMVKAKQLTL